MELLPAVNAPNFTVKQFDSAVDRAHRLGLRVTEVVGPVAFVTSASRTNRVHRVTRSTCDCESHKFTGRCAHRGLCIFLFDCCGGFGQPAPAAIPANVRFIVRRGEPRPAA